MLIDYNKHQSYASTHEVLDLEPLADKWRSFGFAVTEADGDDSDDLRSVFSRLPFDGDKPSFVICHTVKGRGGGVIENDMYWHHKNFVTSPGQFQRRRERPLLPDHGGPAGGL